MAMLRVKDLMSNALEVVSPDAHLHDVLIRMNQAGYRHLPVVADDKLVGIITDRDLRLAVNSEICAWRSIHRLSRRALTSNAKRSLTKSRSINA
jgi:CBS domain-containing protein